MQILRHRLFEGHPVAPQVPLFKILKSHNICAKEGMIFFESATLISSKPDLISSPAKIP
jgi:hypothetical protein